MASANVVQTSVSGGNQNALALQGDGVFLPKVDTASRLALTLNTSDKGFVVYDTSLENIFIWDGTNWESVPASGDAGANGAVQYNDNGIVAGAANLFWDKVNNRLGVGTATPGVDLHIQSAGSASAEIRLASATRSYNIGSTGAGYGSANNLIIYDLTGGAERYRLDASGNHFWQNVGGVAGTAMTLNNVGLGVGGTPSGNAPTILCEGIAGTYAKFNSKVGAKTWSAGYRSGTLQYEIQEDGTERFVIANGGNCGVGVTPSAWATSGGYRALQIGGVGIYGRNTASNELVLSSNAYFDTTDSRWEYITTATATRYDQQYGVHQWFTAPFGTAGNAITFTQAMTLDAVRGLHVDTTAYVGIGVGVVNAKNGFNIVPDNTGNAANRNWNFATNGSSAGNLDIVVSSANNTYPNFAYRMQLTSAGAAYNTTGTWGTISDSRLKENVSDARNYLADLLKLRVVKYSLKEEKSVVATKLGLIAQEVEQVFPSLVEQSDVAYDGGDGIRTVKTSILVPMLLKAIQELTARVVSLEAR